MTANEILQALKEGANFEIKPNGTGWGSISNFPECHKNGGMTSHQYNIHYEKKKKILESIPWTKVVENPRNPKPEEYPTKDGKYITMLDCNEHEVICNSFRDGRWLLYDKTHVKWWMRVPNLDK